MGWEEVLAVLWRWRGGGGSRRWGAGRMPGRPSRTRKAPEGFDPAAEANLNGSPHEITICSCPGAMADQDRNGQGTMTTFSMCSHETQRVLHQNHLRPQDCTPCLQGDDACLKCGIPVHTIG